MKKFILFIIFNLCFVNIFSEADTVFIGCDEHYDCSEMQCEEGYRAACDINRHVCECQITEEEVENQIADNSSNIL